ncbi:MAG TPA: hypothetical protein VJ798_01155 [Rhizomicrobium sp.]|nr:hypothetical protein [Rhizomicrobium sp.]
MNMKLGNFLVGATALFLSAAPALSQDRASAPEGRIVAAKPAHMGEIAPQDVETYRKQMLSAMSMTDSRRRDAAITSARQQLAQSTRKPLTAGTISELDGLLDIGGASPQLGATA